MTLTVKEKLDCFRQEFCLLEDPFSRHAYLIELSSLLPPMKDAHKSKEYRFKGCQANVWLLFDKDESVFYMEADSDSLLIRGILYILHELFHEQPFDEVSSFEEDIVDALGISDLFTRERLLGLTGILQFIKSV
ncbi:MAG: SufE family protein [Bacillota bacterium]|jgi:cysteine desulfuration protein SufE|nr:SufE family protein [Bacillota bacterium]